MSEPRKKSGRTPSKVPAVPGQYATPSRAGRRTTEQGSPLPKAGRSTSLAVNGSRDETFNTPEKAGATPKMIPRSVSASFSTPSRQKRSQQERDLTNSDEKRKVRQEPPAKKQNKDKDHKSLGTWKYSDYLHVGHHTNWPDVQVWANVNGGGILVLRAPVDKTPEDIVEKAWPQEFPLDPRQDSPYVPLQMLEVKSGIAEYYKGDLPKATTETKRDLVTEYLAATWEGREVRIFTEESPGAAQIKDILVGTHRQHGLGVNVYAFVSKDTDRVRFQIHQQDNKYLVLAKKGVDFDDVAFHLAYQHDTPEETKAYIHRELTSAEESPKADGTFSNDVDTAENRLSENLENTRPESPEKDEDNQSVHTVGTDDSDTRIVVLGQEEDDGLSQALQDFEKAGKALKAEVLKREGALLDRHDEITREKERVALLEHSLKKKHQKNVLADQEQSRSKTEELNEKERRLQESEEKLKKDVLAKQADWKQIESEFNEEQDRLKATKESLEKREEKLKKDRDDYDRRAQVSRESLKERQTELDQREAALNAKQKLLEEREKALTEKEDLKLREQAVEKKKREIGEKEMATVKSTRYSNPETPPKQVKTENTSTPPTGPLRASELSAKLDQCRAELAVYKNPYKLRFDPNTTFGKCFHKIPAGNPNAGMYTEVTHATVQGKGAYHNKTFEHFRILQFPSLEVDGDLIQAGYEYDDNHKHSVYVKDGKTKIVQDFEPGMIRTQDGRLLISWNCLKEKESNFTI